MGLINAQFSDDVLFIQWQFLSEKPGVHSTVKVCLAYLYHSLASSIPCSVAIARLMNLLISGRVPIGLGSKATPSLVVILRLSLASIVTIWPYGLLWSGPTPPHLVM